MSTELRTRTVVSIEKCRLSDSASRMRVKSLLLELFPDAFNGRLVIDFQGRTPLALEWHERTEELFGQAYSKKVLTGTR